MNKDNERKCCEIRIRAERRAGQLLPETAKKGLRQKPGDNPRGINSRKARPLKTKLSDYSTTKDQSSDWQISKPEARPRNLSLAKI